MEFGGGDWNLLGWRKAQKARKSEREQRQTDAARFHCPPVYRESGETGIF